MGMFDWVNVRYPLPNSEAQNIQFQSKDLDCSMSTYEITAAGRLVEHHWEYEMTPEDELPHKDAPKDSFLRFAGCIRRKEGSFEIVDLNYHGVFNFYGDLQSGELRVINLQTGKDEAHLGPAPEWFEYNAKFTDGRLVAIERLVKTL